MRAKILSAVILLLLSVGAYGATVVTFDDLPDSALVPSPYMGINWLDNWENYGSGQYPYTPSSPPNRIYTNYSLHAPGNYEEVTFEFVNPAVFNGAYVSGGYSLGVTFKMYYQNVLVHTSATLNQSDIPTFLASGYSGLVDKVGVLGYNGYYVLDDITYDAAGVPEPCTFLMLGFGLAGLAAIRRARR